MRSFVIVLSFVAALARNVYAQSGSRLLVDAPSTMLTCEPASIQWVWTGSSAIAQAYTLTFAVEQVSSPSRRSLSDSSPIRFVRKRRDASKALHARAVGINIAGGGNVPMSDGVWTWNSVGVPVGTYRMALTVNNAALTAYSSNFDVVQGNDTSCLGALGSPASSTALGSTTSLPAQTSTATYANNSIGQATSVPAPTSTSGNVTGSSQPSTTSSQQGAAQSQGSHGGGSSGGKIAAAIIVPLLVMSVLLYICCFRRRSSQSDTSASSPSQQVWSEKLSGLFPLGSGNGHTRKISEPMDPVHSAGLAMHEHAVKTQLRQADQNGTTVTPEHWVDFAPDVQESDAHLVSSGQVDEMVRVSMDDRSPFYQQGGNGALRESTNEQRPPSETTISTMPTYLREAESDVRHTHSSFGQTADGAALNRSVSQRSTGPERSNSIRRKPVPTYSMLGRREDEASTSAIPALPSSDGHSPFSDANEVADQEQDVVKTRDERTSSTAASSSTGVPEVKLQEMLRSGEQEIMIDSPTLPSPSGLHTPQNMSRTFPVSVCSQSADSPVPRTLLDTPRESLTEEQQKELYKLSIHLSQADKGFRVSF